MAAAAIPKILAIEIPAPAVVEALAIELEIEFQISGFTGLS